MQRLTDARNVIVHGVLGARGDTLNTKTESDVC